MLNTAQQTAFEATHEADYRTSILRCCFRGARLLGIPAQRQQRLIVLSALANRFEPFLNYPEREVNALLSEAYDDFHFLKQALIDEGFMVRSCGVYRRAA